MRSFCSIPRRIGHEYLRNAGPSTPPRKSSAASVGMTALGRVGSPKWNKLELNSPTLSLRENVGHENGTDRKGGVSGHPLLIGRLIKLLLVDNAILGC